MDRVISPDERLSAVIRGVEHEAQPRRTGGPTMPGRSEATWVDVDGRAALMRLHVPQDGTAAGVVVVTTPPGHEDIVNHRFVMALAARLVRSGLAVVRPAWTGASGAGEPMVAAPPAAARWRAETLTALDLAESLVPGAAPAVVSLGVTSTLAAVALAESGRRVGSLVMIAPVGRGRTYVRSRGALLGVAMVAEGLPIPDALDPEGSASLPGLDYTPEDVRDWFALDLAGTWPAEGGGLADDVVLVNGPDAPADRSTRTFVAASGAATWTVEGLAAQLDRPAMLSVARLDVADAIAQHLATRCAGERVPAVLPELRHEAVVLQLGPERVTEELTTVLGMPGTVTHAVGEMRRVLVWGTTADEPHSGVGGVWARLARQLARRGITTVRFDLPGFGELVEVDEPRDPEPYELEHADTFARVVRWAGERFGTTPDVGGLCSGSWTAMVAAGRAPARSVLGVSHEAWTLHPEIIGAVPLQTAGPVALPSSAEQPADEGSDGVAVPSRRPVALDGALRAMRRSLGDNPPYPLRRVLAARGRVQGVEPPIAAAARLGAEVHLLLGDADGRAYDLRGGDLAVSLLRRRGVRVTVERDHLVDHSGLTRYAQERILRFALGRLLD